MSLAQENLAQLEGRDLRLAEAAVESEKHQRPLELAAVPVENAELLKSAGLDLRRRHRRRLFRDRARKLHPGIVEIARPAPAELRRLVEPAQKTPQQLQASLSPGDADRLAALRLGPQASDLDQLLDANRIEFAETEVGKAAPQEHDLPGLRGAPECRPRVEPDVPDLDPLAVAIERRMERLAAPGS